MRPQVLWVEKYRPTKIEDCILPESIKKTFRDIVASGDLPTNFLFSGGAGVGKTTVARALANELGLDCMVVNASQDGNIDTLRTKIQQFASTVSLVGGRKILILDEADYLNPNSTQPALRGFMEEFARNTSFILTCNFKNRIITPISGSRCSVIEFRIPFADRPKLAGQFMKRVKYILAQEKVEYTEAVVVELIKKFFPDFRRVLNELQRYSVGGKIDEGLLSQISDIALSELIKSLREKNFDKVRKWVAQNVDNDPTRIFRSLYDSLYSELIEASIPPAILILADYQYKAAFVADIEINLVAALIQIMVECEFK